MNDLKNFDFVIYGATGFTGRLVVEYALKQYSHTGFEGHEPVRNRKLLLKTKEIEKIKAKLDQKGLTAIPLRIYFNNKGWAKLEIALAKGKKTYDKRHSLKERDIKRESQRELSDRQR